MKNLHANILVWVQTTITLNMWVRDLSLALSKNRDCKVGTFTITSTYTSRLFHHTLWSPCVKPDVHQFTSHLFAYEMKMKHVLKLQLKTLSFSNNFYRHYALVIMDSNFKNLRGQLSKTTAELLEDTKMVNLSCILSK